ncbi:membrane-like protein [Sphingobium sp. WCS2017Hpa-17]|uniref:membrane-like protein n=1 Tax=Sphingobium sp. WCS2017Hpa-17 TaxID=3073638 RepID=UPI00288C40FB|nr:membrane-like protein [Sphingobium sp. WCS2017Hpa-17]
MNTRWLLLPLLMIGGCGSEQPAANRTEATPDVVAPINNSVANESVAPLPAPMPPPVDEAKPLVSRETPLRRPTLADYRAIGTEPFWAVTIRGSTAFLERPDHRPLRYSVVHDGDDRAVRYLGEGFTLTATQGPCSDGMSDAIWSDRVQIAFGEGTLKGCGGIREDEGPDGG